jgi:hypothetical protein
MSTLYATLYDYLNGNSAYRTVLSSSAFVAVFITAVGLIPPLGGTVLASILALMVVLDVTMEKMVQDSIPDTSSDGSGSFTRPRGYTPEEREEFSEGTTHNDGVSHVGDTSPDHTLDVNGHTSSDQLDVDLDTGMDVTGEAESAEGTFQREGMQNLPPDTPHREILIENDVTKMGEIAIIDDEVEREDSPNTLEDLDKIGEVRAENIRDWYYSPLEHSH